MNWIVTLGLMPHQFQIRNRLQVTSHLGRKYCWIHFSGGRWAYTFLFYQFPMLNTLARFMLQNFRPLPRWLEIISPFRQLASPLNVSSHSPDIYAVICEARWRKILSRWPCLRRYGYAVVCLIWCQRRFYDENMAIMAIRNSFIETIYRRCIKHIYTVIQFIQP